MESRKKVLFILFLLAGAGLVPYYRLCWNSMAVWIFDSIVSPLLLAVIPSDSNMMMWGFVFWILSMTLCYVLFFLPYILICAILIVLVWLKLCCSTRWG